MGNKTFIELKDNYGNLYSYTSSSDDFDVVITESLDNLRLECDGFDGVYVNNVNSTVFSEEKIIKQLYTEIVG